MLLLRPLIDSAALISSCKAFQSLRTLTSKCSGTSCLKPKSSLHQKVGIRCLLILHVCIFTTTFHHFEATVNWLKSQFGRLQAVLPQDKKGMATTGKKIYVVVLALEHVQLGASPRIWTQTSAAMSFIPLGCVTCLT